MWTAILAAISAALNVWRQERAIYNDPKMVKNKLAIAEQQAREALRTSMMIAANPNSTPEQHAYALRQIRLAGS